MWCDVDNMNPAVGKVTLVLVPKTGARMKYAVKKDRLESSSDVFRRMITRSGPDSTGENIIIEDFSPKAFKTMLRHIFKRPVLLDSWDLMFELFELSKVYELHGLEKVCKRFFSTAGMNPSEAIKVYEKAATLGLPQAKQACSVVFRSRTEDVMLSSAFKQAGEGSVKAVLSVSNNLNPSCLLALVNWCIQDCYRRNVPINRGNVELCIVEVCGPKMAEVVCKTFRGLKSLRTSEGSLRECRWTRGPLSTGSPEACKAIDIKLSDYSVDRMECVFKTDIINELKFKVEYGAISVTGFRLCLKPGKSKSSAQKASTAECPLEVFFRLKKDFWDVLHCEEKVNWSEESHFDVMFSEAMFLKAGESAVLNVCVEELQPCKCLVSKEESQNFVDGIIMSLNLISNQVVSNLKPGPFFIQKLFYET